MDKEKITQDAITLYEQSLILANKMNLDVINGLEFEDKEKLKKLITCEN